MEKKKRITSSSGLGKRSLGPLDINSRKKPCFGDLDLAHSAFIQAEGLESLNDSIQNLVLPDERNLTSPHLSLEPSSPRETFTLGQSNIGEGGYRSSRRRWKKDARRLTEGGGM